MAKILNNYCTRIYMTNSCRSRSCYYMVIGLRLLNFQNLKNPPYQTNLIHSIIALLFFTQTKCFSLKPCKISVPFFLGSQDITVCFLYPIVFNSFWSVYLLCWTISFSENGFSSIFFFYFQRRWATRRFFNLVFLCVPLYF